MLGNSDISFGSTEDGFSVKPQGFGQGNGMAPKG